MSLGLSQIGEGEKKHRENREKLHREHLIGCPGVKLFLLKYVTITTVNTVINRPGVAGAVLQSPP